MVGGRVENDGEGFLKMILFVKLLCLVFRGMNIY